MRSSTLSTPSASKRAAGGAAARRRRGARSPPMRTTCSSATRTERRRGCGRGSTHCGGGGRRPAPAAWWADRGGEPRALRSRSGPRRHAPAPPERCSPTRARSRRAHPSRARGRGDHCYQAGQREAAWADRALDTHERLQAGCASGARRRRLLLRGQPRRSGIAAESADRRECGRDGEIDEMSRKPRGRLGGSRGAWDVMASDEQWRAAGCWSRTARRDPSDATRCRTRTASRRTIVAVREKLYPGWPRISRRWWCLDASSRARAPPRWRLPRPHHVLSSAGALRRQAPRHLARETARATHDRRARWQTSRSRNRAPSSWRWWPRCSKRWPWTSARRCAPWRLGHDEEEEPEADDEVTPTQRSPSAGTARE